MTSSSSSVPALGGSVTRRLDGYTIDRVDVAANSWSIAETIGHIVVGHGEVAALTGGYVITGRTGDKTREMPWPDPLDSYLHSAA